MVLELSGTPGGEVQSDLHSFKDTRYKNLPFLLLYSDI